MRTHKTHTKHTQAEQRRKEAEEQVRMESKMRREVEERAQQLEGSLRDQLNQSGPAGEQLSAQMERMEEERKGFQEALRVEIQVCVCVCWRFDVVCLFVVFVLLVKRRGADFRAEIQRCMCICVCWGEDRGDGNIVMYACVCCVCLLVKWSTTASCPAR